MTKFFFIAGEASGDLHASKLIRSLKQISTDFQFSGIGGDRMTAEGCKIYLHYRKIAFMGFKEVLINLPLILKALKQAKSEIKKNDPDVLVLVDYPGFNLRIASWAKKQGFKIIYFIPPQVWAWKKKRVYKLKKHTDKIICILPFEVEFYKKYNIDVFYAGHPLAKAVSEFKPDEKFIIDNSLSGKKLLALLPGSRMQEIERSLPVMVTLAKKFPAYHFLLAATSDFTPRYYSNFVKNSSNIQLVFDRPYQVMHYARAAIVTSGTAALEAALFHLPMVVVYKTTGINYRIFKFFAKVKFISLVNLICKQEVVTELIQNDFNVENTISELQKLLNDKDYADKMNTRFNTLEKLLWVGEGNAYKEAALTVSQMILS